ncbi:MAG: hypothetical protein ACR2HH_08250 [Chthoniobacterales bacterium]
MGRHTGAVIEGVTVAGHIFAEEQNKALKRESAWGRMKSALLPFSGILGVIVGWLLSSWHPFAHPAAIKAHALSVNSGGANIQVDLALVNEGDHQGMVTDIAPMYPLSLNGVPSGYISQGRNSSEVTGVPVVLNPGEIRLVTIKTKLDLESAFFNATAVGPNDPQQFKRNDVRVSELDLRVQALDFRGRKYRSYWRLGKLFVDREAIAGWQYAPTFGELRVFNEPAYTDVWYPVDYIGPTPTPASSATPVQ